MSGALKLRQMKSGPELLSEVESTLRSEFSLAMLPEYVIVVEGWTDVSYLQFAADKVLQTKGHDLLGLPQGLSTDGSSRIHICTPGRPGDPTRGGVPQVVRLGESLRPYVFTLDILRGLVFILDHDDAGITAAQGLRNLGYKNVLTLDPREHPTACKSKQVVIEDLLSLSVQDKCFSTGGAWCSIAYEGGTKMSYTWHHKSKDKLRDHVVQHGEVEDVIEIARLLGRARVAMGLAKPIKCHESDL